MESRHAAYPASQQPPTAHFSPSTTLDMIPRATSGKHRHRSAEKPRRRVDLTPMQPVLDMGTWGGLAEKHNGVSDACIPGRPQYGPHICSRTVDARDARRRRQSGLKGLDSTSDYWIHQWKGRGSQPGTDIRSTCQFLITHE